MRIGLHDSDNTGFPNLALMKLSAYLRKEGHQTEVYSTGKKYDRVYSAKVFSFTAQCEHLPTDCIKGGTGYGDYSVVLPSKVEHILPDYSLYGADFSLGFITRGCPNKCSWCIVPNKEGVIRSHSDVSEFIAHKDVVLMDNNVLAIDHGIDQIRKLIKLGVRVDFNQGIDARRVDANIARLLSQLKWLHPVRFACDTLSQMESVQKAVTLLRWNNCTPRRYFVYVLVKDIDDAIERIQFLKGLDLDPFAQPYRDFSTNVEPTQEQKDLARWCNHKAIFKTVSWEEYKRTVEERRIARNKNP